MPTHLDVIARTLPRRHASRVPRRLRPWVSRSTYVPLRDESALNARRMSTAV